MNQQLYRARLIVRDIFTSGMYDRCEPGVMYKFMMLNLILILGTPFVLGFGLFDIYRGIEPLGYIITTAGLLCAACFTFLRMTKRLVFVGNFLVIVLFCMFLYLLATGGSRNSGILWYYSFPPIVLFLLGFRRGSAVILASLTVAAAILFWPGTPLLTATYSADMRIRFIPSVVILWSITSLFEHVMTAALTIEVKNRELRETVEELTKVRTAHEIEIGLRTKASDDWRTTFDAVHDPIVMVDRTHAVVKANRALAALLGRPLQDIHTAALSELFAGVAFFEGPRLQALIEGKEPQDTREVFVSAAGKWLEISVDAVVGSEGSRDGAVLIMRDITDIRQAEDARQTLQEQLQQVQKMDSIGRLAGGIAHDFNNILSSILGYCELSLRQLPEGTPVRKHLQTIHKAGGRAAALTQQLLLFSRKQPPEMRPLNLSVVVEEMMRMLTRLIAENISITLDLQPHTCHVLADPGQVEQVLMNLVVNSRDAMPAGGVIGIRTAAVTLPSGSYPGCHGGDYVVLEVSDTGEGMSGDVKARIFEPFFTTKEVGKGTGLGLSTVYGIIMQHQGHIEAQSEPSRGSTFRIYLPAIEAQADGESGADSDRELNGSETILVAEDDADLRELMQAILADFGYTVITAYDGQDAVKKFAEHRDDVGLVILDVIMPGKNGREAYRAIRDLRPDIKALFMSGYTADILSTGSIDDEEFVLLQKPLSQTVLLGKIRQMLDT